MNSDALALARRLAELDQKETAQQAYTLVLQQSDGSDPAAEMEAASYIFFSEGEYQTAYTTFVSLYNRGYYQAELMDLMMQAFYLPNVEAQQKCYQENCELLGGYPYLFCKDFLPFDSLPILFFPFNDKGYIPFFKTQNRFGEYIDFNDPVIDRNFFHDLENPILAEDVFSQYQLEYLNDNVRKSEWVARENHIYLHYTDWNTFCAYLSCLQFSRLLPQQKFVFLVEKEIAQYPIDFAERFGIDYSRNRVRPFSYQEVTRLIWHTQLATHNGGDFFNEIFHNHPNLLTMESVMFHELSQKIKTAKKELRRQAGKTQKGMMARLTDKDMLVSLLLGREDACAGLDYKARIVPAVFFQPHFPNMLYHIMLAGKKGVSTLYSEQYESIRESPIFQNFKYIKTFTPMRRITTSYAASVRFMYAQAQMDQGREGGKTFKVVSDVVSERIQNRSFMIDPQDRLYRDSVLVRFEDGKLNPTATFTSLAGFLDIPYTESMTYCSGRDGLNPESLEGNVRGFDLATVYRTYDEYANDEERAFLEYFLRDAYEEYGYDFHYYKGEPVDEQWIREKIARFTCIDGYIMRTYGRILEHRRDDKTGEPLEEEDIRQRCAAVIIPEKEKRFNLACRLLAGLSFVNRQGQPLRMMKKLELDPALLEQPLYH